VATLTDWIEGARPRTLPAAFTPVAVGTGIALGANAAQWPRAGLALLVALALQVGVNFANDYSDGIRGTDRERVGPVRLVGQGLAKPATVRAAAFASFLIAAIAGLVLVALVGQWWLLIVGAASILAAWLYTGGPRPYGYSGLGEVFVFIFFGIVPVVGTAYVQTLTVTATAVIASVGVGALACAVLVTNNLRDIPTDQASDKHTLAVRIGDLATRRVYVALISVAFIAAGLLAVIDRWTALLALLALPLAIRPLRSVLGGAVGPALVPVLKATGLLVLGYGVLLAVGLAI
jgi:1,4-dihydroxy-2-naphthoate octaprenyltransferase